MRISTKELLDFISRNPSKHIEAQLVLGYGCYATHFMYKKGKYLIDEGIDGIEYKIDFGSFLSMYEDWMWIIDQVT